MGPNHKTASNKELRQAEDVGKPTKPRPSLEYGKIYIKGKKGQPDAFMMDDEHTPDSRGKQSKWAQPKALLRLMMCAVSFSLGL